jgi:hypothetical protein
MAEGSVFMVCPLEVVVGSMCLGLCVGRKDRRGVDAPRPYGMAYGEPLSFGENAVQRKKIRS